jgi:hypothetical protein
VPYPDEDVAPVSQLALLEDMERFAARLVHLAPNSDVGQVRFPLIAASIPPFTILLVSCVCLHQTVQVSACNRILTSESQKGQEVQKGSRSAKGLQKRKRVKGFTYFLRGQDFFKLPSSSCLFKRSGLREAQRQWRDSLCMHAGASRNGTAP